MTLQNAELSPAQPQSPVVVIDGPICLTDALAVAEGRARVEIGVTARSKIEAAHQRLLQCVAENRLVYGVTTGFGPLANRLVGADKIGTLQRNLIYHLATGVGDLADWATARMVVLARLNCIAQGVSGASPALSARLVRLLNGRYAPRVPLKGTVGASGDLTPLSHLALALLGEGHFIDRAGQDVSSRVVLQEIGGSLSLENRDGLALVNGTSVMTAVAAMNAAKADRLISAAERFTVGYAEVLSGTCEAWHPAFATHRLHDGQIETSRRLRELSKGSGLLTSSLAAEGAPVEVGSHKIAERPLQDAYSIRCAPQVIGAVRDVASWHNDVTTREFNSATDNPLFPDGAIALHGGNFMGQHVAFSSDALSNGLLALAAFGERQIARVTDERLNNGLPAFLHQGDAGLNSGLMGAQVTATAVLAEMRTRAIPASIQSISTNGANQDYVSMGTIAARGARDHARDLSQILAILGLAVAQAIDCRGCHDLCAPSTRDLYRFVRNNSEQVMSDRPLSEDILRVANCLSSGATEQHFGHLDL